MNNVTLSGNLVGEPDYKVSQDSGVPSVLFRIAVDKRSRGNKETIFLDCVAFRDTADFIRDYFQKGYGMDLRGAINVSEWTESNGVKRTKYEIWVDHCEFPVSGRPRSGGEQVARDPAPRDAVAPATPDTSDDDFNPFGDPEEEEPSFPSIKPNTSILDEIDAMDRAAKVTAPMKDNPKDDDYNPFA